MKLKICVVLCMFFLGTLGFAGEQEFHKGNLFVTPQFAYYSYAPNFGVGLEYAVTNNIGVGGSVMVAFWSDSFGIYKVSETLITPAFEVYYHFTKLNAPKLDLFAGVGIGYSAYSWSWDLGDIEWKDEGSSSVYFSPILGIRYYLNKKIAVSLKTHYSSVGDWTGMGGELGIAFKLGREK